MQRREVLQWIGAAVGVPSMAALSPGRLFAIGQTLHGRIAATANGRQQRRVLDEHQDRTVDAIAEHIIPETDTPGARAARVNEFIDFLLAEWLDEHERSRFLRGLAGVDARCLDLFGTVFVQSTEAQQIAILSGMDAELTALREARLGTDEHFFAGMKWLTLYGYYTSEIGQTQELEASIIPGRYDPCGAVMRDTSGAW